MTLRRTSMEEILRSSVNNPEKKNQSNFEKRLATLPTDFLTTSAYRPGGLGMSKTRPTTPYTDGLVAART